MSSASWNAFRIPLACFLSAMAVASGLAPAVSTTTKRQRQQHRQRHHHRYPGNGGVVALQAVVPKDQELTAFDKAYLAMRNPHSVAQSETRDYFMTPSPPKTEPRRPTAIPARRQAARNEDGWNESTRPNVYTAIHRSSSDSTVPEKEREAAGVSKYGALQSVATLQSMFVGGIWGALMVAPVLLCHYFYFYPSYESLAQFEWDAGASVLQGAAFAAVYRYALREDLQERKIQNIALLAALIIRSGLSVSVPMECSTPHLQCTIPTSLMSWGMIGELSMSFTESLVLFGAVAGAMDLFLRWKLIRPFPSEKQ